ncbi:MAG: 5'/3'-nucleotidase SurE [Clostridia bacterium]|nr:5'/3'-nucleotidase SurE [Clostridia bacterium]
MRILLTNDDGVFAPGIRALAETFSGAGHEVFVCAPDRERSAAGHSATFGKPLRAETMDFPGASLAWAVDGTPSDCASLGLFLVREAGRDVDMVVSGINRGMNLGGACIYSGTVAAAMEASMCGVPGLAVSLFIDPKRPEDEEYGPAARAALRVAEWMPGHPLPLGAMYNLNVPAMPYKKLKGIVPARLAPVFLDVPHYARTGDDGWQYSAEPRDFDDPEYDLVKIGKGWCTLTKLTWDFRLNADDRELGEIEL